ncbi:NAD(P)-binding protein [Streptomyces sp. NPDC050535]|uniref:NAD(P)-binding protein n=1 Tax=Streptomyces sp. NPDC050535 TaxID=3365626 RepID=UPI00379A9C14
MRAPDGRRPAGETPGVRHRLRDVGAGVGGALPALLLGRAGRRVVVVDARPGVSTRGADFLKPRGLRVLAEHEAAGSAARPVSCRRGGNAVPRSPGRR